MQREVHSRAVFEIQTVDQAVSVTNVGGGGGGGGGGGDEEPRTFHTNSPMLLRF
jgi:hypothetical protein